jgi:CRISPR-associated protein Cas1
MPTLYITTPGARLEKDYQRLIVVKDDALLIRIPIFRVDHVVLVGSAGITTPAMIALLKNGAGLAVIDHNGKLIGRLNPPEHKNIHLRQTQYQRGQDPDFCLSVARACVYGKIRNAAAMAARMRRKHPQIDAIILEKLRLAGKEARKAESLESLRGIEGKSARIYFLAFRQALQDNWTFGARTRRPPKDEINALLGLAYTLLHENLVTALEIAGLDPYEGFFHADKYGRPALALDLMEEFRHIIADSVVLGLVNKRILKPQDFIKEKDCYRLNKPALEKFFKAYQHRLHTQVIHPVVQKKLSYQKCFEVQARLLRKTIEGTEPCYQPFLTR